MPYLEIYLSFCPDRAKTANAMYKPSSKPSLLNDVIVASAGAGVITTLALANGQHPAIALSITAGSALAAVILNRAL